MQTDSIYFKAFIVKHGITDRESDVLRLKFQGIFNPKIASMLGISKNSVKTLIERVCNRLDTGACIEIMAKYIEFLESRDNNSFSNAMKAVNNQ